MKIFGLYASVLLLCAALASNIKVNTRQERFCPSYGEEHSAKQELQELLMLADEATGKIPEHIRQKELLYYNAYLAGKTTRGTAWQSVGPWNVGGRTRAIAFDATNENIMLAGAVSGGIWRTTNGGASWTHVSDLAGYLGVTSIAQDKRAGKQHIWYAATGEGSGNSASGGSSYFFGDGIFKSTDSGKTWALLASTSSGMPNSFSVPTQISWRVIASPSTDSDFVFSAHYGVINKSNDGGNTWATVLGTFAGASAYYTDISVTTAGILYATISSDGVGKGFWRSADNGKTWANITPTNFDVHDRTAMGINPNNENEIYFFTYMPDSTNTYATLTSNYQGSPEYIALMKYTYVGGDGSGTGGTWLNLSNNLPNNANVTSGPFDKLNLQGGYDMFVRVQPGSGSIFIGGTNIFRSTDAFATANNYTQIGGYKAGTTLPHFEIWPNHHPDCHDLLFLPSNPATIFSASDGGVRKAINGNSTSTMQWITLNNGYITSQLYTANLDPTAGSAYMLAGFQDNGNFITTNYLSQQNIWTMPFNGDGAYNYIAPNRAFYVMSIQEGKVGKFQLDNAGNKVAFSRIDPIGATKDDYMFINQLAVDPNDNNIMYLPAGKKIFRQNQLSTLPYTGNWDSISTGWYKLSDTITSTNTSNGYPAQISAIAVSKSPANVVYIGTTSRDVYRIDSANTGNPKLKRLTKSFMSGYVSGIAIDPEDAKKVMVCYSNYNNNALYYSTDGGDTFKYCRGNLRQNTTNYTGTPPSIRCCKIVAHGPFRTYLVGTSVGLYSTQLLRAATVVTKDSTVWTQEGANTIGTNVVMHMDVREADGTVAIATHGGGAYYGKIALGVGLPSTIAAPKFEFTLSPNPATSNVHFSLSNSSTTTIQVVIYDAVGKKILTLPAFRGSKQIDIPLQQIPKGNYFVTCYSSDGEKVTKQLSIQ